MARIRYLKPEFFTDEDVADLKPIERLFYQGLWCHADKAGRLEDRPRQLKIVIAPYDDIDPEQIIERLAQPKHDRQPFINRYVTDGQPFIQIVAWEKHQKPHSTEKESVIPPLDNSVLTVKERLDNVDTTLSPLKIMGKGSVVKGDGEEKGKLKGSVSTSTPAHAQEGHDERREYMGKDGAEKAKEQAAGLNAMVESLIKPIAKKTDYRDAREIALEKARVAESLYGGG